MYLLPLLVTVIVAVIFSIKLKTPLINVVVLLLVVIAVNAIITVGDYCGQIMTTEIWSGVVTKVEHIEEWDEWHPPKTVTYTETYTENGKTKTRTKTKVVPGYWEHHYAKNLVTTSDNGVMNVSKSPDGRKFDDSYPNTTEELMKYYRVGQPSASTHTYENKVKASYSIYRHKDINIKDYPDLPKYPSTVRAYLYVDRILGDVPNKEKALYRLAEMNSYLNKFIPDPERPGKNRSYKQVNIIFVNVGDKTEDYGFALQDSWQGGNKNDFVIAFSMDSDNRVKWVYPFSWSEVEILKLEVRDYMFDLNQIDDFVPVVDQVGKMVEEKFERKQFADFSYLRIEMRKGAKVFTWIIDIICLLVFMFFSLEECNYRGSYRKSYRRYY